MNDHPSAGGRGEPPDPEDPFAGLTLDEQFVRAARITEPAASERVADAAVRMQHEAQVRRRLERQPPPGGGTEGWQRLAADGWDDEPGGRTPRRRRHSLTTRVAAFVLLLTLVTVYAMSHLFALWLATSSTADDGASTVTTVDGASGDGASADGASGDEAVDSGSADTPSVDGGRPSPSGAVADRPLGVPAAVPSAGGTHEFMHRQPDGRTPVAYDPCRPIHYVTRAGGPPGGDEWIRDALATATLATGLQFIDDGTTDEAPSDQRAAFQPERYGDRWAPVLFAWSDPAESPRLAVDPARPDVDATGYAGSAVLRVEDRPPTAADLYVTGSVVLDGQDLGRMAAEPDGARRAQGVVAHEVAHLLGLDHVDDADQLMYPVLQPGVSGYGDGDLEGLAALGRGACFPEV